MLAIRTFLAKGGRQRRLVPARERSLELFGHEKRLDTLCNTALLRDGPLSLELLRCYDVAPPLVWTKSPIKSTARAVLLVENLHTYESFCRWNERSGQYVAVAYGQGSEFKGTCRDLPRLLSRVEGNSVEYFGDLDAEGLQIAVHAACVLRAALPPLDLRPSSRWYDLLFSRSAAAVPAITQHVPDEILGWLPESLREPVRALLDSGKRLPQELIGTDALAGEGPTGVDL